MVVLGYGAYGKGSQGVGVANILCSVQDWGRTDTQGDLNILLNIAELNTLTQIIIIALNMGANHSLHQSYKILFFRLYFYKFIFSYHFLHKA